MTPGARRAAGFGVAGLVFAADQLVKALMIGPFALPERQVIELIPAFDLRWAQNYGVSFSLFTAGSDGSRWALVALTAAIALGVMVWMLREKALAEIAALGMVLGGALGNILDRARLGYVVDYADLHFGEFRPFQIFNLADAAISIGVVIVLARSFLSREKHRDETGSQTA
ncbi:signal peptidase II [Novosphingobium flavum]|uniref:Lipoprotein signal peptidase n=1 Tax=Novosphingobium flavum TaxID=1778672 RepID=A0A7X1KKK2_9SPHN|nr:signal peptidase II [Novosphingobium flavum]MBC2664649.1 signal peptidase II [Novosphingobium flavum]